MEKSKGKINPIEFFELMCGIAGIMGNFNGAVEAMKRMLTIQQHRGPDAQGIFQDEYIILGHNRLSIIDLAVSANQPMYSSCGRYIIVFNGEIYNYLELRQELIKDYPFSTNSDTEVILNAFKAWGVKMLDRFIGMFTFAIWDKTEHKLLMVRDRFGVKPLYYALQDETLCFASEIKTLWAAGISKKMNLKVWANYLHHGSYGMPEECFWDGIHQLPAGHLIEIDYSQGKSLKASTIIPKQWYDFVAAVNNIPPISESELKEEYTRILNDSIRLRFRSDVPVGFNISGGLDSSILLALVKRQFPKTTEIEAFSFYTGHPEYDELPWVKQMIDQTYFPLNACQLQVTEVPELFNKVSFHQDEPFGGLPTLAYSKLFATARSKGIKVLLDGQGMDEAWAGYDYYRNQTNSTIQGLQSSPYVPKVLSDKLLDLVQDENYPQPFNSALQNKQYRDLFYTKIPRALRFNDRVSMMHSTELREPFLDHRLVELAFAQPDQLKLKGDTGKALLRQWATEWIGTDLSLAPKRAMQTPQREWLGNELKNWVSTTINELCNFSDLVDGKKVKKGFNKYLQGNQDSSFHIWQWKSLANATKSTQAA